jgi:peptidoglycan-associated lipoprotein
MKTRLLYLAVALALGGCATQSKNESGSSTGQPGAASPSGSASQSAPSSGVRGAVAPEALGRPSANSVYYDFDKSDLRPGDRKVVEAQAQYLRQHPELKVRVEGNADERGSTEYNLALGQRRADGVAKAMELLGVSEKRVEAVSYGEEKPRATGHDEAAWAQNRRSDIVY